MSVLNGFLLSVCHQGVEVPHKKDWGLETLSTCFSDVFEYIGVVNTVLNSDLNDQLDIPATN